MSKYHGEHPLVKIDEKKREGKGIMKSRNSRERSGKLQKRWGASTKKDQKGLEKNSEHTTKKDQKGLEKNL